LEDDLFAQLHRHAGTIRAEADFNSSTLAVSLQGMPPPALPAL